MRVLENVGIVIENAGLYPELTGFNNLKMLSKLNKKIDDEQIRKTIVRVGLNPNDKRSFKKILIRPETTNCNSTGNNGKTGHFNA